MAILAFQKPDKVIMLESDDRIMENLNFVLLNLVMVLQLVMLLEESYYLRWKDMQLLQLKLKVLNMNFLQLQE